MAGSFPQDRICEAASESSGDSGQEDDPAHGTNQITVRVSYSDHTWKLNFCTWVSVDFIYIIERES